VRKNAAIEEDVELVLDEVRPLGPALVAVYTMKLAACLCTRR
jgi:hypothetical protein